MWPFKKKKVKTYAWLRITPKKDINALQVANALQPLTDLSFYIRFHGIAEEEVSAAKKIDGFNVEVGPENK